MGPIRAWHLLLRGLLIGNLLVCRPCTALLQIRPGSTPPPRLLHSLLHWVWLAHGSMACLVHTLLWPVLTLKGQVGCLAYSAASGRREILGHLYAWVRVRSRGFL